MNTDMNHIRDVLRALEKEQEEVQSKLSSEGHRKGESMLSQFGERSPFQILISTVLSARTKDTTTIPICKILFDKYPDAQALAKAATKTLHKILYGIGFYRVKSQRIKDISKILLKNYNGEVPKTLDELLSAWRGQEDCQLRARLCIQDTFNPCRCPRPQNLQQTWVDQN